MRLKSIKCLKEVKIDKWPNLPYTQFPVAAVLE